ncbi:MAG: hypothetical protein SFH39_18890 [Candidatus Magnetobacterium sp. LHC-1]
MVTWTMDGATLTGTGTFSGTDSSWIFKGLGRFNSDANVDILWQSTSGEFVIWLMNGSTSFSSTVSSGVIPSDWVIQ